MKTLLTIITVLGLSLGIHAQNVVFKALNTDHSIGDNLPDTVEVFADSLNQVIVDFECFIVNNEAEAVNVKITREIVDYVPGANDQLCWGTCTMHTEDDSFIEKQELTFEAYETKFTGYDDVTNVPGLGGVFHYLPLGNSGTTILKYTLISVNNDSETAEDELVIKYTAGSATSVISIIDQVTLSKPYPNPAHQVSRVKYNFNTPINAQLVVTNIIGSQIYTQPLYDKEGEVLIELSDLPVGLYFVNIESNGRILTNQKLIKK